MWKVEQNLFNQGLCSLLMMYTELFIYPQAMLRYRSGLLKLMETLILSPFMLSGYSEEKQLIRVSLIESFVDNPVSRPD